MHVIINKNLYLCKLIANIFLFMKNKEIYCKRIHGFHNKLQTYLEAYKDTREFRCMQYCIIIVIIKCFPPYLLLILLHLKYDLVLWFS